ncbi:hypothetical protein OGAPHI_004932 [Ogataea philodendri]|uniref:Enoyl reductase (ER) domain-containing protein n=1 Tax=Ogataea philodendri TaxID=1378263 RepID=A0A9P8T380_9ASCO|nr:uncharacterized protein OGAPHI_004932 [Ogataea philodendri]KAH3663531.1 hypothetical protein OGAPHI_004932 [Ogataea philodendri]
MSQSPSEFKAIGLLNLKDWPNAKSFSYKPYQARPQDVDIKIISCGICGSDLHASKGHWGDIPVPRAFGHEIVGEIVALGDEVDRSKYKIGQRVGVGAQCDSCGECYRCNNHKANCCRKGTHLYLHSYPDGTLVQGGYASHIRVNSRFAIPIPEGLASEDASPMLCGGITGFRPLLTYGVKKGTKVGVSGIGGIGHMTIMFAKALGAEVTAISRSNSKKALATQIGADHFVATNEEGFEEKYADTLDLIVNTASDFEPESFNKVTSMLKPDGRVTFITAPPVGTQISLEPMFYLINGYHIGGSAIGSPEEIEYMLKLAAEHNIKPMIETFDISEENVKKAWERVDKGDVRFRAVLTGYDKFFK